VSFFSREKNLTADVRLSNGRPRACVIDENELIRTRGVAHQPALAGEADVPRDGNSSTEDAVISSDGCSGMTSGDHLMQQTNGQQKLEMRRSVTCPWQFLNLPKRCFLNFLNFFQLFSTFSALLSTFFNFVSKYFATSFVSNELFEQAWFRGRSGEELRKLRKLRKLRNIFLG
jgi:hypothetical protein